MFKLFHIFERSIYFLPNNTKHIQGSHAFFHFFPTMDLCQRERVLLTTLKPLQTVKKGLISLTVNTLSYDKFHIS